MVVLCRSNLQERMSEWGQSLPKRDIRVTSIYPSISDMILQLSKRRKGPEATIGGVERLAPILGACKWHTMSIKDSVGRLQSISHAVVLRRATIGINR
jgi:hypothetical protein